jgi:hypothetical protein
MSGTTKATELAASYYDRIEKKNPRLNAYLSLTKERALATAARVDDLAAKGDPLPPLAGIPVGIKDVLVMQRRSGHGGLEDSGRATGLPTTPRRFPSWRRLVRCAARQD